MAIICVKLHGYEVVSMEKRDIVETLKKTGSDLCHKGYNINILLMWIRTDSYYMENAKERLCVVEILGVRFGVTAVKESLKKFFANAKNVVFLDD